jgi:hypothetical protein
MYGWACASCRRLAWTQCRVPSSSMPSPIVAVRSEKARGYCFLFVCTYGDPSSTRYQGLRLDSNGRPRLLEMVPRRQGHGGQLKLVLDPPTILQKPTSSASSWGPFLLPSLPLPPFYDEAMPPKKRTRPALKTDGVKIRAAERKELTRR